MITNDLLVYERFYNFCTPDEMNPLSGYNIMNKYVAVYTFYAILPYVNENKELLHARLFMHFVIFLKRSDLSQPGQKQKQAVQVYCCRKKGGCFMDI